MLIAAAAMEPRLPLLITGITGVAGYSALHYFQRRYPGQVIGIRPHQTWQLQGEDIIAQDADDPVGLARLFRRYPFRSVLNTVGNCALKSCELDPQMARQINVVSAAVIVEQCRSHGSRLVQLSSDLVFSGTRGGNHLETDPVDPVTVYGKNMVQAEQIVLAADPGAAVLRISLPMGPSYNRHAGAIDWIDSRFRKHRPATLYFDEVRSPTYCDDMNVAFEWFLASDAHGLYHAGGPRFLTLHQIAQVINRVGGYAPQLLKGCPRILAGPMPPRAGDVSMCSDKLIEAIGSNPFRPWPLWDELAPTDRDWHHCRSPEEQGSFQHIAAKLYRYQEPETAARVAG